MKHRRRTIVRTAIGAYAVLALTACIFDRSTYQGGGHNDQGGTQRTPDTTATATEEPTTTTTNTTPTPIPDAAVGG